MKKRGHLILAICGLIAALCLPLRAQLQYTNLPTVYVDTWNNAGVYSKVNYVSMSYTQVTGDSVLWIDFDEGGGIRGRGNSTWNLAKKPYRLKFGSSIKLLGKGHAKSKHWVLLANHADKSMLRNAVTSELGEYVGLPFNPAVQFIDFALNGTYLGTYQLTDQIKVDGHRVEVSEQDYPLTEESDISGGYLVEVDGFGSSEPCHFRTKKNIIISVKYPDDDEISNEQVSYIKEHFQKFEDALFSSDFKDPQRGYRAYVDSATLVNWYIATELSANVDGFWSTYIYKERGDDKLYFGPLWDYDIAYNNCNRVGDVTRRTMTDAGFGSDLTKVWVMRMLKDDWFNRAVNDRWKQLVRDGIERHLLNYTDSLAAVVDASQQLNYSRWSITNRVYNEIYLYSTYQEYVDQLKRFISEHTAYLTEAFAARVGDEPEEVDPTGTPFETDGNYYFLVTNRGNGNALDVVEASSQPGSQIELNASEYARYSQQWNIVPAGDGYFRLVNRETGLALNDPTPEPGILSTRLDTAEPDAADTRQLWQIVMASADGYYNFINQFSGNAMNNSGGGSANGNPVVSYTSDGRNATSNNRQWSIQAQERLPEPAEPDTVPGILPPVENWEQLAWEGDRPGDDSYHPTAMEQLPTFDYRVVYRPQTQTLRFDGDADGLQQLSAELYDVNGRCCLRFAATDGEQSVAHLPAGIYLLRWQVDGTTKSVKFLKQ